MASTQPYGLEEKVTADELDHFPNDGNRYEVIEGELFVSPAPAKNHQRLLRRLFRLIDDHVAAHNLGEVFFAPVDVRFSEFTQVQPDLLFLSSERKSLYGERILSGAPDLVVEVASPSTRSLDRIKKRDAFERYGVREYWMADPNRERLTILTLEGDHYRELPTSEPPRSLVFPDLVIDLDELMAELDA